ncbi:MAG TPA: DUF308 domain-containing protein [Patescibacteria group bacterium]|nr:DUF308 domain-containing protein [Patescibacteria group bacterium]
MAEQQMVKNLWGIMLMRGIAALLFGVAAVFWPGLTLVTLVYLFSTFILINGIISLIGGIAAGDESFGMRMLVILLSVLEIGVGVYLLRHPLVTFSTLILLVGFILIIRGIFDIVGGLFGGHGATNKLLTILGGLLAGLVGIVVLFQPAASGVAFVWILGLYALITGPLLIAMALDVKNSGGQQLKRA